MSQSVKKLGIFGGSFNPVHLGHLVNARFALEHYDLTSILFVPCASPPHKEIGSLAPAADRMAMLRCAMQGQPGFELSDIEIRRPGTTYTIDTLTAMRRLHPGATLFFIIGSDTLFELHGWKRIGELLELCRIITLLRPGSPVTNIPPSSLKLPDPWPERLLEDAIEGRLLDIAASDIRDRVRKKITIRHLVPDAVADYIDRHQLYATPREGAESSHPKS